MHNMMIFGNGNICHLVSQSNGKTKEPAQVKNKHTTYSDKGRDKDVDDDDVDDAVVMSFSPVADC
jgi:hypothetical protein